MIRLPWTVVRHTDLDELYDAGRASGLETAERLVGALGEAMSRGDVTGLQLMYPVLLQTLADERARCLDGVR